MTPPVQSNEPGGDLPELCHSLMEHAPVPMAELEGSGHILRYVNPAFCRLVGKDRNTLIGKPFAETVQEGDQILSVLDRVYCTAEPETHTESEHVEPHPAYWTYAIWPVLDANRGSVGVMMQVTETTLFHQQTGAMNRELLLSSVHQHELREAAEQLNERLRAEIAERERAEEGLRALATELNLAEQRERKRLATDLHDYLAQLLVLCRMTLAQAKRIGLPPRAEDFVKETEETLGKALTFCRTLMVELNPPVLQEQGLPAGLTWLADHMQRQELAVTVDLEQAGDAPLPQDRAVLLFQSVRELLINVAKHGIVKRAMVRMTNEDGLLRIVVRDENGFDLAAVASSSDNPSPLSSKFGLLSIRERMKALGGNFDIQSAPGEGTTATLTLPVAPETASHESRVRNDKSIGKAMGSRPSTIRTQSDRASLITDHPSRRQKSAPIRVLLVDDHAVLRQGLRSIVATYEHLQVVGEAGDGVEAVELAQRLDPDVVVMDINMPNMDGIEATRRIKAERPDIVIIGLSVQQSPVTGQKMKAAGAAAYLTKESAVDTLCHAIEEAVYR